MEKRINLKILLEACRRGNRGSQKKLYEHFYAYGMSVSLRYSKNNEEAKEILNDAFLKVFTRIDQYDSNFPFKGWFRKVLVNTALDYYRSRHQKQAEQLIFSPGLLESELQEASAPPPRVSPEEDLLPIVQQLPPAYRMVFNLYVMEEYKHHEIADMLNISVSTSKSNLFRAKAKLRDMLLAKQGKQKSKG